MTDTWMARAIALAERARPHAHPNPAVGCVLVRDGELLAEGWTQPPGGHHAEAMALAAVDDARGATAYVTLEPCAHHGRTPPCADVLVEAGVDRVVLGSRDPHDVARGGTARLRGAGVLVEESATDWTNRQLAGFLTATGSRRPHLTLKLAQTVDGSLTNPNGRWITGEASRRAVHQLRARADAVLVGSGTVLADDPSLDVRHVPTVRGQPRRIVLDGRGRTGLKAKVADPWTIFITATAPGDWVGNLRTIGSHVHRVSSAARGGVDLEEAMTVLMARERAMPIHTILAEPGETLAAALLEAGLVDRVVRHVATTVQATDGAPRVAPCLEPTLDWPVVRWVRRGEDLEVVQEPVNQ